MISCSGISRQTMNEHVLQNISERSRPNLCHELRPRIHIKELIARRAFSVEMTILNCVSKMASFLF